MTCKNICTNNISYGTVYIPTLIWETKITIRLLFLIIGLHCHYNTKVTYERIQVA